MGAGNHRAPGNTRGVTAFFRYMFGNGLGYRKKTEAKAAISIICNQVTKTPYVLRAVLGGNIGIYTPVTHVRRIARACARARINRGLS